MALPIHHPFWAQILVVFVVAGLSALLVYARAERIMTPETVASLGLMRVRRDSALSAAFLALAFGIFASVVHVRWASLSPEVASRAFLIAGVGFGVVLSILALVLSARKRMRGAREVILLNALWAFAYGYVLPSAAVWWAGG